MRETWDNLSAKHKRYVAIGGGSLLLLGAIWMFSGDPEPRERRGNQNDTVRHVLTDRDTRDVSIDGLAAQIRIANQQNDDLRRELDSVRRQLDRTERTAESSEGVRRELDSLQSQLEMVLDQNMDLMRMAGDRNFNGQGNGRDAGNLVAPSPTGEVAPADFTEAGPAEARNEYEINPEEVFRSPPPRQPDAWEEQPQSRARTSSSSSQEDESSEGGGRNGIQIISHYQGETEEERAAREAAGDKEDAIYLPAGSIITGVMLNGMDAPTSQGSRRDPFPSTIRIQHEAVLPNRFRADIRECFLIVSGYGDLSSERAYLRGETISCVRDDGGVVEARLDSYAVGEDGKAGVRGRLVSKQGAMIARSMMAGFMSGAANAFDVNAIPVIQTENIGSRTQYQSNFSPSMFQGAAAQGASNALDRIAQFYVDMAEGIFPVIEIDAGRQVELIMTRGARLQIRN